MAFSYDLQWIGAGRALARQTGSPAWHAISRSKVTIELTFIVLKGFS